MNKPFTIVCFGPGPKFKGGIQNYNTSLALALDKWEDTEVHIVSWTQQYPAIIPREFVDKKSRTDLLSGSNVKVRYITNYNNPISWKNTADYIQSLSPDLVIFQWSIALQGLPIGYIIKRLRNSGIKCMADLHFVIQKENSAIDKRFTKLGISRADSYIVHARKTFDELQELFPQTTFNLNYDGAVEGDGKAVLKLFHPIYNLFKPDPQLDVEKLKQQFGLKKHVFLFFGFIRKYKGLHLAIEAFKKVAEQRDDVSLLICGESFWQTLDNKKWSTQIKKTLFSWAKRIMVKQEDDENNYRPLELIEALGIQDRCVVINQFIPNEDVNKYFQVSDAALLFYLTATPSGIESVSYNFRLPLIASRVGHFPETIRHGYNGYLTEPLDTDDMAEKMLYFLEHPIDRNHVAEATKDMSWENYAKAIRNYLSNSKK